MVQRIIEKDRGEKREIVEQENTLSFLIEL